MTYLFAALVSLFVSCTSPASELASQIPLDMSYETKVKVLEARIHVRTGERILIITQMVATTELPFPVMLGRYVEASINGETYRVLPAVTSNVTREIHHQPVHLAAIDYAKSDGVITYRLMAYAASTRERKGDFLKIERGYGKIQAERF